MQRDIIHIGDFRLEPERNLLVRGGQQFTLEPRIMDVLCLLASDPGAVFSRDALIDSVWQVEHGGDESLTRAISVIRKTVREAGEDGPFIETIPRKGYRLAAPVSRVAPEPAAAVEALPAEASRPPAASRAQPAARTLSRPWGRLGLAAATVLAILIAAALLLRDRETVTVRAERLAPAYSIAVLPFDPFSAADQDARFADGMTEDLINALSEISGLLVAARTSSFRYKGEDADVRSIGAALGVDFLVDGTVRRSDDTIRVTAQLIRAEDGYLVWSDTMEEPVADTFALKDDIVRRIAIALELRLGVGDAEGLSPRGELDPRAVDFYYEGLQRYADRFIENGSVQAAREALRAAVELEPDFAEAWSALAQIGISWSSGPLARDKDAFIARLEQEIAAALALNDDDAALHAALVAWHAQTTIDLNKARLHLARAEALAPDAVETLVAGSIYHWVVGNGETALDLAERVQRRDPLNDVRRLAVALRQAELGDFDAAFEFFEACARDTCLQEGFVAYASAAAIFSGDADRMNRWAERYDTFAAFTDTLPRSLLPRVVEINGAFYATGFGRADAAAEQARVRGLFEQEIITDHIGLWAPTFAGFLAEDTFFTALETAHERGDLLSSPYALSALYGINPYPDWVLEHPRYHAFWARPGLAELAAARRENGWTAGLPK